MKGIELYRRELPKSRQEFVQDHPHPFVVFASGPKGDGASVDVRQLTIDRFVVEAARPVGSNMMAAEVVPRDPNEKIVTIGVNATCDLVIDDNSLSKQHAWFGRLGDAWQIWDNDSVAGTQVNGQLLQPGFPRTLESGDVITLGYIELTFLVPEAFFSLVKHLVG